MWSSPPYGGSRLHQLASTIRVYLIVSPAFALEAGSDDGTVGNLGQFGQVGWRNTGTDEDWSLGNRLARLALSFSS